MNREMRAAVVAALLSGAGPSSLYAADGPYLGAGVAFYLWKIGVRAEYERFQVKDVDRLQMLSLSVLFQF